MEEGMCTCEHKDHFDNGPAHKYAQVRATKKVLTSYGIFLLCAFCQEVCHNKRKERKD